MFSKSQASLTDVKMDTKPSIFISYSRKNVDFVERLVQRLKGFGFDCWIDRHDLTAGTMWREEISHSIRQSQAFILVVSSDSMQSSIVAQEVSLAEFHERPIIPLIYEVCDLPAGIDLQIQHLHWVNFAVDQYDDAMVQLETALHVVTDTPQKGQAKSQKHLKSWIPWVGSFYFLSGIYHLAAMLLFLGEWHGVFNSKQLYYFEHLSGLERSLWISIALLNVAGSVCLLKLRRLVVGLFVSNWCIYTVYVVHALMVGGPDDSSGADLVSYGLFSLAVWYIYRLQKANLLSPSQASEAGNEKEITGPPEVGVSTLAKQQKGLDIRNVIEKSIQF